MGAVQPSPQTAKKAAESARSNQVVQKNAVSLVEKFALQMGGVQPEKMLTTLKATAFRLPAKYNAGNWTPQEVTNEQMMALLVVANKYGLNPFIKEIYAFPDKGGIVPIVGVDGWSRMINDHPQFDGMKFEFNKETITPEHARTSPVSCTCIIHRKDRSHATEVTEYLDEVYREPFIKDGQVKSGPWQSHTKRMLRHKAMIQAARLAFGFTGIHDQDEAERIVEGDTIIPAEREQKAQTLTNRFSDTTAEIVCDADVADEAITPVEPPDIEAETDSIEPQGDQAGNQVIDVTANLIQLIIEAESSQAVDEIISELDEHDGLPTAKKMIVKKAAKSRKRDFANDAQE